MPSAMMAEREPRLRLFSLTQFSPFRSVAALSVACAAVAGTTRSSLAVDPFADRVVEYVAGAGANPIYQNPTVALGSPERITGETFSFPSLVTPFNPAFGNDEIVDIAPGGFLTVAFNEPVQDDAANPFGIDLLIFGNSFFVDASYPDGRATGIFSGANEVRVQVSQNGSFWVTVPGVQADNLFPTLGYSNVTNPYAETIDASSTASDFTKPVDPNFNPFGLTYTQLLAGYAGSGGGAGVDISSTGFAWISYVRIDAGSDALQIDALSDVSPIPSPAGLTILALPLLVVRRRRWS